MNYKESKHATDVDLMKKAKMRVMLKSIYKGLWVVYFIVNVLALVIWFLIGGRFFWPGLLMASWGFALIILGVIISFILSGVANDKITSEYNKLKQSAMKEDNENQNNVD